MAITIDFPTTGENLPLVGTTCQATGHYSGFSASDNVRGFLINEADASERIEGTGTLLDGTYWRVVFDGAVASSTYTLLVVSKVAGEGMDAESGISVTSPPGVVASGTRGGKKSAAKSLS